MNIVLVTPVRPSARAGNWHTAARWAQLLRESGHHVRIATVWNGKRTAGLDLMIALHARRSAASIRAWAAAQPRKPLVLALTGTDLYRDIARSRPAQRSLALADRLLVLQELGKRALPHIHRAKTRTVYQSAPDVRPRRAPHGKTLTVCVFGHLRAVKDPFRAAAAAAYLPAGSRIRVIQAGAAYSATYAHRARAWMRREPRYEWRGELSHARALALLAKSHVLVVSSWLEGGANVISEALTAGVPVIASRVPGNVGMLGARYRGYYRPGDARSLARVLARAENDPAFYRALRRECRERRRLVTRARERAAIEAVVREFSRR